MNSGNFSGPCADPTAFEQAFVVALCDPEHLLPGLSDQPGFAVYRNTVMKGCIDALQANHPAVVRLVGEPWFRAAAVVYVRTHPPRDACLLRYGEDFAEFLQRFPPATELPYLGGVAWLDRAWTQSHTALDAPPAWSAQLAALAPQILGGTVLRPHPSARWAWFDRLPVHTLWQRSRASAPPDQPLRWAGEGALLTRIDGSVQSCALDRGGCALLNACADGAPLGQAAQAALAAQPDTDLTALLALLLRQQALLCPDPENPS